VWRAVGVSEQSGEYASRCLAAPRGSV